MTQQRVEDTPAPSSVTVRRSRHEGPKRHVIAFVFSILLTLIAFATVMSGEVNTDFIYLILFGTAVLQVFVQLAFWMHMKDKGHKFAIIAIIGGVVIATTCVVMASYWVWW